MTNWKSKCIDFVSHIYAPGIYKKVFIYISAYVGAEYMLLEKKVSHELPRFFAIVSVFGTQVGQFEPFW